MATNNVNNVEIASCFKENITNHIKFKVSLNENDEASLDSYY